MDDNENQLNEEQTNDQHLDIPPNLLNNSLDDEVIPMDNTNREELITEMNQLSLNTINRLLTEDRGSIQQNVINISSQFQNLNFLFTSNLSYSLLLIILFFFQFAPFILFYLLNFVIYIIFSIALQKINTNPPQLKIFHNILLLAAIAIFIIINFHFQPIISKIIMLSFTSFKNEDFESIISILYYVFYSDIILRSATIFFKISTLTSFIFFDKFNQYQPKMFLLIDSVFDIYRCTIPIMMWFYFFHNYALGDMISFFYLSSKFISIISKMRTLFKSISPNQLGTPVSESEIMERGEKCSICMEDKFTDPILLNCNHIFCHSCIDRWLDTQNFCPLCRANIPNQREAQSSSSSWVYIF